MTARAVLITGATGKQGGSVVNALLKANSDLQILALTRNAQSASAQRLAQKSPKIELITGDLDAIEEAFRTAKAATQLPIWGVFSVQVGILECTNRSMTLTVADSDGRRAERSERRAPRQSPC
jgi:NAD(P)-dependent dehydrogenase (short-subunit alcohol dehydrogenase family)